MKKLAQISILLILLFEMRFFYIMSIPLEKFNTYHNKLIIFILIITTCIMLIIKYIKIGYKKSIFFSYVIFFIVMYFIQFCISILRYNQTVFDIFSSSYYFLIVLFYFILIYYVKDDKTYNNIIRFIVYGTTILAVLFILQAILYSISNRIFLNIFELNNGLEIQTRGEGIRLTQPSTLLSFSIILSYSEILKCRIQRKRLKSIYILNVLLGIIYLLVVCKTRVLTISVIGTLFLITACISTKDIRKKSLIIVVLIFSGIIVLNLNSTKEFIKSFNQQESGSVFARKEAISYFTKQFKESMLLGRGFINDIEGTEAFYIVHGPQGYLNTTDVGIVGLMCIWGSIGLVWFFSILIKMINIIIKIYSKGNLNLAIELIGIFSYIILTSLTLIITDRQRIILLPISLAIFEYNYKNTLKISNNYKR